MASIDMLERSLDNSLQETHQIENALQEATIDIVPRINDTTHATQQPDDQDMIVQYRDYQHQSMALSRCS